MWAPDRYTNRHGTMLKFPNCNSSNLLINIFHHGMNTYKLKTCCIKKPFTFNDENRLCTNRLIKQLNSD